MHTTSAQEPSTLPTPLAGARPVDVVPARRRPIMSVAVVLDSGRAQGRRDGSAFRYSACSDEYAWTGTVRADSAETAILNVLSRIREQSEIEWIRFLVQVPARSTLWALRDEIALLIPGVSVERPRLSDEQLVRAAHEGLWVEGAIARTARRRDWSRRSG